MSHDHLNRAERAYHSGGAEHLIRAAVGEVTVRTAASRGWQVARTSIDVDVYGHPANPKADTPGQDNSKCGRMTVPYEVGIAYYREIARG